MRKNNGKNKERKARSKTQKATSKQDQQKRRNHPAEEEMTFEER